MKITRGLKLRSLLADEITRLKKLIREQNSLPVHQKSDYDTRELLEELRVKIEEMVRIRTAIARANLPVYDQIFRAAEIKGLITLFSKLHAEPKPSREQRRLMRHRRRRARPMGSNVASYASFRCSTVEHATQFNKVEADTLAQEFQQEMQALFDKLDEFNASREIAL